MNSQLFRSGAKVIERRDSQAPRVGATISVQTRKKSPSREGPRRELRPFERSRTPPESPFPTRRRARHPGDCHSGRRAGPVRRPDEAENSCVR